MTYYFMKVDIQLFTLAKSLSKSIISINAIPVDNSKEKYCLILKTLPPGSTLFYLYSYSYLYLYSGVCKLLLTVSASKWRQGEGAAPALSTASTRAASWSSLKRFKRACVAAFKTVARCQLAPAPPPPPPPPPPPLLLTCCVSGCCCCCCRSS